MKYLLVFLTVSSCISAMDYAQNIETIEAEYNKPFVVTLSEPNQMNWTCLAQNPAEVLLVSEQFTPIDSKSRAIIGRRATLAYVAVKPTLLKFQRRELDAAGHPVRVLEERIFNVVFESRKK